jgi:hypothetical protein
VLFAAAHENADDLGEAADEGTDDALKAENTGATMQYPNSYWMVCFAFRGARQDTSAIAALCDHNRLGISQLAPLLEAWIPPPSFAWINGRRLYGIDKNPRLWPRFSMRGRQGVDVLSRVM